MKKVIAALGLALTLWFGGGLPANAQETMIWRPTTAAGGAFVPPDYWDKRAEVVNGTAGNGSTNITVAPTQSNTTYMDYSVNTTDVQGGQTNVTAQGHLANGGIFTVTTGSGSSTTTGPASSTNVTSNSSLGNGSTVTNTTSTTTNGN